MENTGLRQLRQMLLNTAPSERSLRLATGMLLFAFITCHLVNHAFGVRSIAALQAAKSYLIAPWQTPPGLVVLYGALLVHGLLGLVALVRRRHLRLPASEAWQLALGLAIPLLLLDHAGAIRIGSSVYGLQFDYERILYHLWVISPDNALVRQWLLLSVAWVHGCIGLRAWLQTKPWYARVVSALVALATLVPALALVGVVSAGLDVRDAIATNPSYAAAMVAALGAQASTAAAVNQVVQGLTMLYLGLIAGLLAFRALRDWYDRRFGAVRITYPGNRTIAVPAGFSVLEASRWAGIPHTSVCGGRGRCSTCRIRIVAGVQLLAPAGQVEARTLRRIGEPLHVRLACQVRPTTDLSIEPLVLTAMTPAPDTNRFSAAIEGGRELTIAAMFVDMRESTRLAAGRLPYDALFLFDRYIQTVTGAIRRNGGHVTSVAGDGVMSVFGVDGNVADAARGALQAALDVWSGLEVLNAELAGELQTPLRIGIGIHVGLSVIGVVSTSAGQALQFLGDSGNIAAKLEGRTKHYNCTVVASVSAVDLVAPEAPYVEIDAVMIDGRADPVRAAILRSKGELQWILSTAAQA